MTICVSQQTNELAVSAISWLANDSFLIIYTPSKFDMPGAPDSTYVLVSRQPKTANFTYQKLPDPCPPFGMNRSPPHHFIQRLRNFPPNLTDVLLLSSTAAGEIGLFTCAAIPLSSDGVAANTANIYTTTGLANDARRAQLPVNEEMTDTSPIGFVLDLSSKESVKRPIPGEEIDTTATPLPALFALNNEGVLSAWWFVYSDSVRQGTAYPDLVSVAGSQQQARPPQQTTSMFSASSQSNPAFGSSAGFGAPTFGTPSKPVFGAASFGTAPQMGAAKSPWGTTQSTTGAAPTGGAAFGTPAFGSATPLGGATFGSAASLGGRTSAWGTPSNQPAPPESQKPAPFGGVASTSTSSPFAALGGNTASKAPFSSFASAGSAFGAQKPSSVFGATNSNNATSLFGSKPAAGTISSSFGAQPSGASILGAPSSTAFGAPSSLGGNKSPWASQPSNVGGSSAFGGLSMKPQASSGENEMEMEDDEPSKKDASSEETKVAEKPQSVFGQGLGGFQLKSTFKPDASSQDDSKQPASGSLFGAGFGKALDEAKPQPPKEVGKDSKSQDVTTSGIGKPISVSTFLGAKSMADAAGASKLQPMAQAPKPTTTDSKDKPSVVQPEPAPFPPSPTRVQPEPAPFPPSPTIIKTEPSDEPAPLPPSPNVAPLPPQELSPAGSPPVDLGEELSSPLSSGKSAISEHEGSVEAEDAPLPPDSVPRSNPAWNFPSTSGRDAKTPNLELPPGPSSAAPSPSPSPFKAQFSATKPPVLFGRPGAIQESPRSPSPVRSQAKSTFAQQFVSPENKRPQQASLFSTTPQGLPSAKPQSLTSRNKPAVPSVTQAVEASDESDSSDGEDERIQLELEAPVQPTRRLEPFIAHQDYVGKVVGDDIPAQAERVYRDINSMIDTLGLNARSLKAFVQGHSESFIDGGRERDHLEKEDEWCLIEIEDLAVIEKELGERLEAERLHDAPEKLTLLASMQKSIISLRTRAHSLQTLIASHIPGTAASTSARTAPLSTDQSATLVDLRRAFEHAQRLLADAEDAASLLAARLAALEAQSGSTARTGAIPTVEAVANTIAKMTRMAEQKSGDVDVLEARMRRARFHPVAGAGADVASAMGALSLNGSRAGSVAATPPAARQRRQPASRGTYALTYDSDSSAEDGAERGRGGGGEGVGLDAQRLEMYKARVARRARVFGLLKEKIEARGVRRSKV